MKDHTNDNVSFGFWVYLMSDCVLFAALFATYAVLQGATFGGPTAYDLFNLPFVFVETMLLLTSSFTMGLAVIAARAHKKQQSLRLLAATLILGLAFLGMEVYEFTHLIAVGEGPATSAFLSAFFTLVGTHGLHVAIGAIWMCVVGAHIWFNGITSGALRKLTILSLFWHFLDVIWICIFTFVYLFGGLAL
ncbi:MAG: cytochrome o ubiquinol oxidase subunit III [Candidatus Pacebacteria bacterium]|nr:cytochrome o ubiquinol oxidase subunit III [Candidatus Paceibacterota bacterium]